MKKLFFAFLFGLLLRGAVINNSQDFISNKRHLIIFADGTPKEVLDAKQPVINSWRENMLEVRNMCKIIECNFLFMRANSYPNRFVSNKCYINNDHYCESSVEKNSLYTIEQIIHEADYATTITLGGESYGMIANSKTEDSLVFEIGDNNIVANEDENRALLDQNKKEI